MLLKLYYCHLILDITAEALFGGGLGCLSDPKFYTGLETGPRFNFYVVTFVKKFQEKKVLNLIINNVLNIDYVISI